MWKNIVNFILILGILLIGIIGVLYFQKKNPKVFEAQDFQIEILKSYTDYDQDGLDDYSDILEGAKKEAKKKPIYQSNYYAGGYPPEGEGVCTDVIWRALQNARI